MKIFGFEIRRLPKIDDNAIYYISAINCSGYKIHAGTPVRLIESKGRKQMFDIATNCYVVDKDVEVNDECFLREV